MVAILLAAGVPYRYGVALPPGGDAVVMSLSRIIGAVHARPISYRRNRSGADTGSGSRTQNAAAGGSSQLSGSVLGLRRGLSGERWT